MALLGKRGRPSKRSKCSPSTMSCHYSMATTKAVKPKNHVHRSDNQPTSSTTTINTATNSGTIHPPHHNLQQREQQQQAEKARLTKTLQQEKIRAIERKRTVAFAKNANVNRVSTDTRTTDEQNPVSKLPSLVHPKRSPHTTPNPTRRVTSLDILSLNAASSPPSLSLTVVTPREVKLACVPNTRPEMIPNVANTSDPLKTQTELPAMVAAFPGTTEPEQQPTAHQASVRDRVKYDMECVPPIRIEKLQKDGDKIQKNLKGIATTPNRIPIDSEESSRSPTQIRPSNTSLINDNDSRNILQGSQPQSFVQTTMQDSVLWIPSCRQDWEDCISEMKAVCTSAAFRRWSRKLLDEFQSRSTSSSASSWNFHPPLAQAFIKDRVRIDDPLRGYQIRHAQGGWLQGFLLWTNFTVWTQDFHWDSLHTASGLPAEAALHRKTKATNEIMDDDYATSIMLASELESLPRGDPDPMDGGRVFHQVAEISLLGGLGCGRILLQKAIAEIANATTEDESRKYKYVVLQATEGSRSFYQKMGFVRVGAVCRYRWAGTATVAPGKTPTTPRSSLPFNGYRHWTYTNESSVSLDAHGGPSVMMCLKLPTSIDDLDDAISIPISTRKPNIHPIVKSEPTNRNPNNNNSNDLRVIPVELAIAPTRKSKRKRKPKRFGDDDTGEPSKPEHQERQEYEAPDNCENVQKEKESFYSASPASGAERGFSAANHNVNANAKDLLERHGSNSSSTRAEDKVDHLPHDTLLRTAPEMCGVQTVLDNDSTFRQTEENNSNNAVREDSGVAVCVHEHTPIHPPPLACVVNTTHPQQKSRRRDQNTTLNITPNTIPSATAADTSNSNKFINVASNAAMRQKRKRPRVASTNPNAPIGVPEVGLRKTPCTRPRRQSVLRIDKSKLLKCNADADSTQTSFNEDKDYTNRVVVLRKILTKLISDHNDKLDDDHRGKPPLLHYNGGLMIDHGYEYCYYFVLEHNRSHQSLTIVPMVKDGVFEPEDIVIGTNGTMTKRKNTNSNIESCLGRPLYRCNILETDKNWIRGASIKDYQIMTGATSIVGTPFIADETWDIALPTK